MTRYIGIDPGKSETTAVEIVNGKAIMSSVPSVVAPHPASFERVRQQSLNGGGNYAKHISLNGNHWQGGAMAWRKANPIMRFDAKRFTSEAIKAIIFLALDGLGIDNEDLAVYFALPYNLTKDPDAYELLIKELETLYIGSHHMAVNGVHKKFTISKIGMDAQPKLALFGHLFDDNLKWIPTDRRPRDKYVIYDHGFGDLGIVTIDDMVIDDSKTEEREVGMSEAAKILIKLIDLEYKNRLNLFDADALIRQAVEFQNAGGHEPMQAIAQIDGYPKDVMNLALTALNQYLPIPLGFAHEMTGNGNGVGKIMVGGGAYALHGPLQEAIGSGIMLDAEPSTTVARGAAKFAKAKFSRG